MQRPSFEADLVFDGDELERRTTRDGDDCIVIRGVIVDTGDEIVERTVLAFGDAVRATDALTVPGTPVRLMVEDRGPVMVVTGRAA